MFNKKQTLNIDNFKDPHNRYRMAPFWFWNSKLDRDEIKRQIYEMDDKGLGGFFIHARFGLETDYMSEEWMACARTAVETADELSMYAWLYDEYPFPSGIGAMEVTQHHEYRNKYIDLVEEKVPAGEQINLTLPSAHIMVARAFKVIDGEISPQKEIDLKQEITGNILNWRAPLGSDWQIVVLAGCILTDANGKVFGPDYLNEKATQTFLRSTHDKYKEYLGDYFGNTIPGIFTDEPCLLAWHQGHTCYRVHHDARLAVWSESLEEKLINELNLPYTRTLLSIFHDLYPDSMYLRRQYRQQVAKLYVDNFFVPYQKWCADHNLSLTGHVLLEEGLYSNTIFQGDFMKTIGTLDIPGSDFLGKEIEGEYKVPNVPVSMTKIQGQKIVSSTAHLQDKDRVICEVFGVTGWSLNFKEMKKLVDWLLLQGINFICPHAFFYSLEGFRKADAPPTQFYHNPYWKDYKKFADYTARLCYLLSDGRHVADIGLVYPLGSFYSHFKAGQQQFADKLIADTYDFYADKLRELGYDYDIINEDMLVNDNIEDGRLQIAQESYSVLVLPAADYLNSEMIAALKNFVAGGGILIGTLAVPGLDILDEEISLDESVVADVIDLFNLEKDLSEDSEADGEFDIGKFDIFVNCNNYGQGKTYFVNTDRPLASIAKEKPAELWTPLGETVRTILDKEIDLAIEIDINGEDKNKGNIEVIHNIRDERHVFFLANHAKKSIETEIKLNIDNTVDLWNPETGVIQSIKYDNSSDSSNGSSIIEYTFAPYQSLFLVEKEETEDLYETSKTPAIEADYMPSRKNLTHEKSSEDIIDFADNWEIKALDPNVLIINDWDTNITIAGNHHIYSYFCELDIEHVAADFKLLFDDIEDRKSYMEGYQLYLDINGSGEYISDTDFDGYHLEEKFKYLEITDLLQQGKNNITLKFYNDSWGEDPKLLTSSVRLLGSFALEQKQGKDNSYKIIEETDTLATGSWVEQGYPYYSGDIIYNQEIEISEEQIGKKATLYMEEVRDVVHLEINGREIGRRLWPPYQFDITDYVKTGKNSFEFKISNSLANLMAGEGVDSGIIANVYLKFER